MTASTTSPRTARPDSARRLGVTPQAVVIAVAAAVAVLAGAVASMAASPAAYWLGVAWLVWVGGLVWALTRRPVSIAFVVLWVWLAIYELAGATVAVQNGEATIGTWVFRSGLAGATRLVAVMLAALWAGAAAVHAVGRGRAAGAVRWPAVRPDPVAVNRRCRRVPLDRAALVLVAVGVGSLAAYVIASGASFSSLNVVAGDATFGELSRTAANEASKVLKSLAGCSGAALIVIALRLTLDRRRPLVPLALATVATVAAISGGGRSWLLIPLLAAALVAWKCGARRPVTWRPRRVLLVGAAATFVLAAFVGGIRGQADPVVDPLGFVAKETIGVFPPTVGLVETVPAQHPYLGTAVIDEVDDQLLPRAVQDDKPEPVMTSVQLAVFGRLIGASFALPGDWYAGFGLTGVIIGCLLFGAALETLWRRFVRTGRLAPAIMIAAVIVVLLQLFSRGYFASQLAGQLGFLAGAGAVALWLRGGERAAAAGSA